MTRWKAERHMLDAWRFLVSLKFLFVSLVDRLRLLWQVIPDHPQRLKTHVDSVDSECFIEITEKCR